jgi:hypothetical protein
MRRETAVLARLRSRLVPERSWAEAFESAPPVLRALCKHNLAALHALFGEAPDREEHSFSRDGKGLRARLRTRPADWALIVFDAKYASAPRLLAAVMPALLARVPFIPVVCTGGAARPELLCALELAGREQTYLLDARQGRELLRALVSRGGRGAGRLVLLHTGGLEALRAAALETHVPCWEERRPPVLHVADSEVDMELLRLAHPDAVFSASPLSGPRDTPPDAVYRSARATETSAAGPLTLAAGMEGVWVHPRLSPDFFREREISLAPGAEARSDAGPDFRTDDGETA